MEERGLKLLVDVHCSRTDCGPFYLLQTFNIHYLVYNTCFTSFCGHWSMLDLLARGAREWISQGSALKPWRTGVGGQIAQCLHFSGKQQMACFTYCLDFFSCCCNRMSWQTQLKGARVYFSLQFQEHVVYNGREAVVGRESKVAEVRGWLVTLYPPSGSREWGRDVCCSLLIFLLYCPGYQLGNGAPHSRHIFLPQLIRIKSILHRLTT